MNGVANGLYGGDLPNQINTPWIDFSEQSTIVGWSTFTQKTIRYKVVGNIVYVVFNITGTSNSTTTSFTLPVQSKTLFGNVYSNATDNNASNIGGIYQAAIPSQVFIAYRHTSLTAISLTWTASGTKQIQGQFFYEI